VYYTYVCAECGQGFWERERYLAHVHPITFDDEGTVIPLRVQVQLPRRRAVARLAGAVRRVLRTGQ
jgi:hypothetical protein